MEIGARRLNMSDAFTGDLIAISEWGRANRVDFNARKSQCCFLTHQRNAGADVLSSVSMCQVNTEVVMLVETITFFECRRKH